MLCLENRTAFPFTGWLTATVANAPDGATHGKVLGMPLVLGKPIGLRGRMAFVLATLPAGAVLEAEPVYGGDPPPPLPPLPPPERLIQDLGVPKINRVPLDYQGFSPSNGGPIGLHFRARFSRMLVADLDVFFVPGQGYAQADLSITASNPSVPDLGEVLHDDINLTFGPSGPATVQMLAGAEYSRVMVMGDSFADGQLRGFFGTIMWPRLVDTTKLASGVEFATGGIGFTDQDWQRHIGPLQACAAPSVSFNGRLFTHANYMSAMERVRSWQDGPLGIVASAGSSGEQEDQGFGGKGTEVFTGGGFGAAQLLALTALEWGKRPCHYLEQDGSFLRLDREVAIWSGRVIGWSPDQLGKPRQPTEVECRGWSGPDNQHWLVNRLCCAWQLTGRPILQRLIHHQAILFLNSQTLRPDWATSMVDAGRAWGWTGLVASWLWVTLEDRNLANLVKERYRARIAMYRQATGGRAMWDVRLNDADSNGRPIGVATEVWSDLSTPSQYPQFWFSYQQCVAAGLMQVAGEVLDIPEARILALAGAIGVIERAYQNDGTEWETLGVRQDGSVLAPNEFVEGRGAHRTGNYATAWMPLAPWVVLRHDPGNERALFLYNLAKGRAHDAVPPFGHPAKTLDWLPPL